MKQRAEDIASINESNQRIIKFQEKKRIIQENTLLDNINLNKSVEFKAQ